MSAEDTLVAAILTKLLAQFPEGSPPHTEQDGMQRIATAVGKAIAETLPGLLVVTTTVQSINFTGSVALR